MTTMARLGRSCMSLGPSSSSNVCNIDLNCLSLRRSLWEVEPKWLKFVSGFLTNSKTLHSKRLMNMMLLDDEVP